MKVYFTNVALVSAMVLSFFLSSVAHSQDDSLAQTGRVMSLVLSQQERPKSLSDEMLERISLRDPDALPNSIEPLFFTKSEIELVKNARKGLVTRAPTPAELLASGGVAGQDPSNPNAPIPRGPRDIKLGGIVFLEDDDWTIWLNNMKVRPNAIPEEVLDLNVYKEYIEIEWFDAFTNQIFPIRLRPNQTFNIDSRIFLPG